MIAISIFYILLGLFLGLLFIHIMSTPPKVIFEYPTIEKIKESIYVDENNRCYKLVAEELSRQI